MKNTVLFTIAMLCAFGFLTVLGATKVSDKWQEPQESDIDISTVSPVENVTKRYKEYRWANRQDMPDSREEKEFISRRSIDITEDMTDFDIAGYTACKALDSTVPWADFRDITLYGYARNYQNFLVNTRLYSFVCLPNSEKLLGECRCDINAYTGKVVQVVNEFTFIDKRNYQVNKTKRAFTDKQADNMLEYALEICCNLGYADFESYTITSTLSIPYNYSVFICTERREVLRVYFVDNSGELYCVGFSNEKENGYCIGVNSLSYEIPREFKSKYSSGENIVTEKETEDKNLSMSKYVWPVPEGCRVSRGFTSDHREIDIAGPIGTAVYACGDGTVVDYGYLNAGKGVYVTIELEGKKQVTYSHCKELIVSEEEKVKKGQVVAFIGSTGNSTGPHLSFKVINEKGEPISPYDLYR